MKKNKSFSNKIFKQTLKKLLIFSSLEAIISIIVTVLLLVLVSGRSNGFNGSLGRIRYSIPYFRGAPIAVSIAPILIIVMIVGSIALTLIAFKYLNKRPSSDYYHSLPYTKTQNYTSRICAVLTIQYSIIIITMLAALVTLKVIGLPFIGSFIPQLILGYMAGSTFIIGGVAIAMSLSGNILSNLTLSTIILILPRFLLYVFDRFILEIGIGLIPVNSLNLFLNPTANIPFALLLDFTRLWEYTGASETLININSAIYCFVVGIVYLLIAYLLMKKRKSELAENSLGTARAAGVVAALCSMPFIVLGVYLFISRSMYSYDISMISTLPSLVVLTFVALIIFIIMYLILFGRFKGLVKKLPIFIAVFIISFGIVYAQKAMAKNIVFTQISAQDVVSISIDDNDSKQWKNTPLYSYSSLLVKEIVFTDDELISLITEQLDESISRRKSIHDSIDNSNYKQFKIWVEFTMKNGKKLTRFVSIYLDTAAEFADMLMQNDDYYTALYTLPEKNVIDDITLFILRDNEELTEEIYDSLYAEVQNDPSSALQVSQSYNPILRYYNNNNNYMDIPTISSFLINGQRNKLHYQVYYNINDTTPITAMKLMNSINDGYAENMDEILPLILSDTDGITYDLNTHLYYKEESKEESVRRFISNMRYEKYGTYGDNDNYGEVYLDHIDAIIDIVSNADLSALEPQGPYMHISASANFDEPKYDENSDIPIYYLDATMYIPLSIEEYEYLLQTYYQVE